MHRHMRSFEAALVALVCLGIRVPWLPAAAYRPTGNQLQRHQPLRVRKDDVTPLAALGAPAASFPAARNDHQLSGKSGEALLQGVPTSTPGSALLHEAATTTSRGPEERGAMSAGDAAAMGAAIAGAAAVAGVAVGSAAATAGAVVAAEAATGSSTSSTIRANDNWEDLAEDALRLWHLESEQAAARKEVGMGRVHEKSKGESSDGKRHTHANASDDLLEARHLLSTLDTVLADQPGSDWNRNARPESHRLIDGAGSAFSNEKSHRHQQHYGLLESRHAPGKTDSESSSRENRTGNYGEVPEALQRQRGPPTTGSQSSGETRRHANGLGLPLAHRLGDRNASMLSGGNSQTLYQAADYELRGHAFVASNPVSVSGEAEGLRTNRQRVPEPRHLDSIADSLTSGGKGHADNHEQGRGARDSDPLANNAGIVAPGANLSAERSHKNSEHTGTFSADEKIGRFAASSANAALPGTKGNSFTLWRGSPVSHHSLLTRSVHVSLADTTTSSLHPPLRKQKTTAEDVVSFRSSALTPERHAAFIVSNPSEPSESGERDSGGQAGGALSPTPEEQTGATLPQLPPLSTTSTPAQKPDASTWLCRISEADKGCNTRVYYPGMNDRVTEGLASAGKFYKGATCPEGYCCSRTACSSFGCGEICSSNKVLCLFKYDDKSDGRNCSCASQPVPRCHPLATCREALVPGGGVWCQCPEGYTGNGLVCCEPGGTGPGCSDLILRPGVERPSDFGGGMSMYEVTLWVSVVPWGLFGYF